jgi:hypothetical protein
MKNIYIPDLNNLQIDNNHDQTIVRKIHTCGCKITYYYPHCTKQDTKNGGCYESCACQKYIKYELSCENHK